MNDKLTLRPTRAPECLAEEMDGEILVYHPSLTTTLHLNNASAMVWRLCDGERSVSEIITTLVSAFPDQQEAITTDVPDVVEQLLRSEILVAA